MNGDSKAYRKKRAEEIKKEFVLPPWVSEPEIESTVSWNDIDALLVAYVVYATTEGGASAQFTRSRDGGALGVRIYDDRLKTKTEWSRPGEGLEELLYGIADYYRESVGEERVRWS